MSAVYGSTQTQALCNLLFLYRFVLKIGLLSLIFSNPVKFAGFRLGGVPKLWLE